MGRSKAIKQSAAPVLDHEKRAIAFLEVDPAAVESAPKVSHLFRFIEGGQPKVWEMLEISDSPEARKLVETRAKLNGREQQACPFEAIAVAAGLTTKRAFGVVSEALVEYSQDASRLILHANTPALMEKAVENAKKIEESGERKTLLQATSVIPRPKNTVTIVQGDVVKGNKNQVAVLPDPGETGRRLGTRFGMEMTIPAALPPVEEISADDYDDDEGAGE